MNDVIVDCTELYANPTRTGIQRVVREMLRHWPDDGPRIHLARFDGHGLAPLPERVLHLLTDNDPDATGLSSAELARRLELARQSANARLPSAPALIPEVFYDSARAEFHCARTRALGLPLAMIAYDFLPFLKPELFRIRRNAELMWYVKAIQAATSVAHISTCTKQAYDRRVMRGKGVDGPVLPLGSDGLGIERQQWRPDRQSFVSLGSIDGRKNQEVIVEAFKQLWNAGHHAPLVLIGSVFPHMDDSWLREALACPQFRWLSQAHDADIAHEFRRARATIYTSTAEGFGLPPVESLAAGVPVIAFGGIPSLAMLPPQGQLRLEAVTEKSIADAVLALSDGAAAERLWAEVATQRLPTWKEFGQLAAEWVAGL